jgi:putative Mn2+ efflux pump MntP
MDAFSVSVCYGACYKKSNVYSILKLSFFLGLFQGIMPILGFFAGTLMSTTVESYSSYVAGGLLILVSGKMVYEALQKHDNCDLYDISKGIRLVGVSIATSIDAFAVGISIALISLPVWISVTTIGLITFLLCILGSYLGKKIGSLLGNYAEIAGSIVLLVIALKFILAAI